MKAISVIKVIVRYIVLILFALCVLFPLFNALINSVKTNAEIYRMTLLPGVPSFQNYVNVFKNNTFYIGLINSLIITVMSIICSVAVTSIASYGISRRKEKRFTFIYIFFLSSMMIPVAANMTALYSIVRNMGLLNTRTGLIFVYIAGAVPMGIMLYTGFIKSIPRELDEAATIDGCGYVKRFYVVILPLLKPIIVTHILMSSINIWNDFFTPLLLISSPEKKTLTFAVYSYMGEHATDWGSVFAMLTLAMLPPILMFLFSQKHFYSGITAGAVKG